MNHGRYVLDENGAPRLEDDLKVWGRWFEDRSKRRVSLTALDDGEGRSASVSTIFLGLDHGFCMDHDKADYQPVLWETMVQGDAYEDVIFRYTTVAEARAAHERLVLAIQSGSDLEAANEPVMAESGES